MAGATTSLVRDLGQTLGPAIVGAVALGMAARQLTGSLADAGLTPKEHGIASAVLHEGGPLALHTADLGPLSAKLAPLHHGGPGPRLQRRTDPHRRRLAAAAVIAAVFVGFGRSGTAPAEPEGSRHEVRDLRARRETAAGSVGGDQVHPFEHPVELLDLVMEGEQTLRGAGERALTGSLPLPLADVRLLPPLQPPTVRDYMTFEGHVAGIAQGYGDTVPEQWYAAPAFYFTNPYAVIGAHDDVPVPPGCARFDFELEVAAVIGKAGPGPDPRAGTRAHPRLHDPQRLVRPRPARPRDEGQTRPGEGQGHGNHPRPLARHRRRTRTPPQPGRLPRPRPDRPGQRRDHRPGPTGQHGLDVRGDGGVRLPRHLDPPRRRPGLRHLRQRRLPGRTLGPPRRPRTPAARPRRHRHHDGRGHRHHQQHRRRGGTPIPVPRARHRG